MTATVVMTRAAMDQKKKMNQGKSLLHCGKGLSEEIFGCVSFTFSPRCLGTFLCGWCFGCLLFMVFVFLLVFFMGLGVLQLLHFLLTSKRTSDRSGHKPDWLQRKKLFLLALGLPLPLC